MTDKKTTEEKALHAKGLSIMGASTRSGNISPIGATYYYNLFSLYDEENFNGRNKGRFKVLSSMYRTSDCLIDDVQGAFSLAHTDQMDEFKINSMTQFLVSGYEKGASIEEEPWRDFLEDLHGLTDGLEEEKALKIYESVFNTAEALALSTVERDLLFLFYYMDEDYTMSQVIMRFVDKDTRKIPYLLSQMLYGNFDKADEISKALDPSGTIVKLDLVSEFMSYKHVDQDGFGHELSDLSYDIFMHSSISKEQIVEKIIGKPADTDVSLDDFPHIKDKIEEIKSDIEKAVENKEEGISILLYGPAGTGKTTLAAAIAKELGLSVYAIAEDIKQTEEVKDIAELRRKKLVAAQSLLAGEDVLLFFDEAEDLTIKGGQKSDVANKIGTNNILTENKVVTIYACNDMDRFHESFLQRFTHLLNVPRTPSAVRKKQWAKQFELNGLEVSEATLTLLGRKYDVPPRMMAHSVETMTKLRPHLQDTPELVENIDFYLRQKAAGVYDDANIIYDTSSISDDFNADLIASAEEGAVSAINKSIANDEKTTVFIKAKSGSGLFATTRYISDQMEGNIVEAGAGVIMNPGPMASPTGVLKQMFAQAAAQKSLLVIHDIENFVEEPKKEESYHASPMLSLAFKHMANHPYPVVFATQNSDAKIDGLFEQYFSHSLKLGALSEEQLKASVKHFFDQELEKSSVLIGQEITIGDVKKAYNAYETSGRPDGFDLDKTINEFSKKRKLLGNRGIGFGAHIS